MPVAVDWGSTSFRAYHFSADNRLLNKRNADCGIKAASALAGVERDGWFEARLLEHCADWIRHDKHNDAIKAQSSPPPGLIFSGMITSRNGWFETPYVDCPVSIRSLFDNAVVREVAGVSAVFLPGVAINDDGRSDVMRGEELQLIGTTVDAADTVFVLPGTHSKWVQFDGEILQDFQTLPTGEIYATLLSHTLIGALASGASDEQSSANTAGSFAKLHPQLFKDTVVRGFRSRQFFNNLFGARAGVLLERLRPDEVPAYLSALLIGREFREATRAIFSSSPGDGLSKHRVDNEWPEQVRELKIRLIGEPALCDLYAEAATVLGMESAFVTDDTAAAGFTQLLNEGLS